MRAAALLLLACAGCGHAAPAYEGFDAVPYGYANGRTFWGPRAKLRLHVEVLGSGEGVPLVLLHPWGLNMTVWAEIAPRLAEDRRVLLLDLPGHGKSSKVHTTYPMRRLAAAVLDAMDEAGMRRAVIAGNSLGGATALATAELAPQRVEALILVAAPGGGPLPAPVLRAARGIANRRWLQTLSDEGWFLGVTAVERSLSPHAARIRDDLMALSRTPEWAAWSRATITILRSVAVYAPDLEDIEAPALVVHGTGDLLITEDLDAAMAERLPRGRLTVLEGCGHLPEIECPQALLGRMERFLAEVVSSTSAPDVTASARSGQVRPGEEAHDEDSATRGAGAVRADRRERGVRPG